MRFLKLRCVHALVFALSLLTLFGCKSDEDTVTIRIVHTTDVHGNYFSYNFLDNKPGKGSLSRLATYLEKARKENPNLLLLDGGDILQGTPASYYYNYVDTTSPHVAAQTYNYLKYDAVTIGNHDIETGHAVYDRWSKECDFPVLAANLIDTRTNKPYFKPYIVKKVNGVKVAIIGFITPAVPEWVPQIYWQDLGFEGIVPSAQKWMDIVLKREKPDVILALMHSGLTNLNHHYIEDAGEALLKEVSGFDAILLGHDHKPLMTKMKNMHGEEILMSNPGGNISNVSDITIKVRRKNGKVVSKEINGQLIDLNDYSPNKEYDEHFAKQAEAIRQYVSRPIGTLVGDLNSSSCLFGQTAYMSLIQRVEREYADADISFAAPFSLKINIKSGPLYIRDLFRLYRFENSLYQMELTGQQIKDYLELSYARWVAGMNSEEDHLLLFQDNNDGIFKLAYPVFNMSSAGGVDYIVDLTKPVGSRVSILQLSNGQPFSMTKKYKVAVNSYRGGGGGDLMTEGCKIPFEDLRSHIIKECRSDIRHYIHLYIEKKGKIEAVNDKNWHFVPEAWAREAASRDAKYLFK